MSRSRDHLLDLCASVRDEAVLVAPFMKRATVDALVKHIGEDVRLTCVTRWWPEEIVAGVSDLEVLNVLQARGNSRLLLYPRLHAKYFRGDGRALAGSANLTHRALGWVDPANLELLVPVDPSDPEIAAFEKYLLSSSVEVDDELLAAVNDAVTALHQAGYEPPLRPEDGPMSATEDLAHWVPLCPSPDRLFNVYADINIWELVTAAERDARQDLAVLNVPPGLSRENFERFVAAALDQMPLVNEIDRKAASGLQDEAAIALLNEKGELSHDAEIHWRIFKGWLTHFFPARYRRRSVQEELVRSRTIRRG